MLCYPAGGNSRPKNLPRKICHTTNDKVESDMPLQNQNLTQFKGTLSSSGNLVSPHRIKKKIFSSFIHKITTNINNRDDVRCTSFFVAYQRI